MGILHTCWMGNLCKGSTSLRYISNGPHSWHCICLGKSSSLFTSFLLIFRIIQILILGRISSCCSSGGWIDSTVLVNEMWRSLLGKIWGTFSFLIRGRYVKRTPVLYTISYPILEQRCMTMWYREMLQPYGNHGKGGKTCRDVGQKPDLRVPKPVLESTYLRFFSLVVIVILYNK